eukprot:5782507-Ditylum_brightwellii.AAC.1
MKGNPVIQKLVILTIISYMSFWLFLPPMPFPVGDHDIEMHAVNASLDENPISSQKKDTADSSSEGSITGTSLQVRAVDEEKGKESNRGPRNVILFGPHDRYNFGDLLFTKVLVRLLENRAGYDTDEILFGGVAP